MSTAVELLARAESVGLQVLLDGDGAKVVAATGALPTDLLAELRQHKLQIIDLLHQREAGLSARVLDLKRRYNLILGGLKSVSAQLDATGGKGPEYQQLRAEYDRLSDDLGEQLRWVARAEKLPITAYPAEIILEGFPTDPVADESAASLGGI